MAPLPCPECGGAGEIEISLPPYGAQVTYRPCRVCFGKGYMRCEECGCPAVWADVETGPVCEQHRLSTDKVA